MATQDAKDLRLLMENIMFQLGGSLSVELDTVKAYIEETLKRHPVDYLLDPAAQNLAAAQEIREHVHQQLADLYQFMQTKGWITTIPEHTNDHPTS